MPKLFNNSIILITGGTGSWGQELTKQLLTKYNPKEIRIYSRGELNQVEMKNKFNNQKLKFIIGDVRDKERLMASCRGVDYFFHLAALKHVTICEKHPEEAIKTNILGTQNAVFSALGNKVKKFIYVSTDKAVDPLNLYGITKACGEKIVTSANQIDNNTVFTCVRGGNVLGSNGSVIPLFRKQIETMNAITITDPKMTRFIFSLRDAIGLVIKACEMSVGGEIFVMKMPSLKITDLAEVMINELGDGNTKTKIIGIRPGEKIDEVLVSRYECDRVIDEGGFYIILPSIDIKAIRENYSKKRTSNIGEFTSKNTKIFSKQEIKEILKKYGFLNPDFKYTSLIGDLDKGQLDRIATKDKWLI